MLTKAAPQPQANSRQQNMGVRAAVETFLTSISGPAPRTTAIAWAVVSLEEGILKLLLLLH